MAECPRCGFGAPAGAAECPVCRTPLGTHARAAGGPIPWEDPGRTFPGNLAATIRESMLEPGRFFARVPWEAAAARPVLYLLLISVVSAFFTLLWGAAGVERVDVAPVGISAEELGEGAVLLLNFTLSPFLALAGLVLSTLVLHLFALLLARRRRGIAATARAVCYASGPGVLAVVPLLGTLAASIWGVVLLVVGLREAHRTTTVRAVGIVFLPALLFGFLVAGLLILGVLLLGRLPLPGGQLPWM